MYLKEKEYSLLAWEFVSLEIRRFLVFANNLTGKQEIKKMLNLKTVHLVNYMAIF